MAVKQNQFGERKCIFLIFVSFLCETDPIGVVVDVEALLIVHGRDGDVVLQVFGEETAVRHVEVEGVAQLHVHVALQ